ncbi:MAG: hypothetical protein M3M95_05200, partial [Pseudomonadota bacterium]|nr:hypothetical protein [Pseudomonadota bacterium]
REAERPYPRPSDADLPAVLKALYLQQRFSSFAVEVQGATPEALHARFGEFLKQHRPGDPAPTQPPGVVVTPESVG